MNLTVSKVSKLTGITVRTLHYYDEIGLLIPEKEKDSGYRLYSDYDLKKLQQIMFYRELDFSLSEIAGFLGDPSHDDLSAMCKQKKLLQMKEKRLVGLIKILDKQIKGEEVMKFESFKTTEIEKEKEKYYDEIKSRWGETEAYLESEKRSKSYTKENWLVIQREFDEITKNFADMRNESPDSKEAQGLVKKLQSHISKYYYNCTKEILAGLGKMYVSDERFTKNIDKFGEETAKFESFAIEYFCR